MKVPTPDDAARIARDVLGVPVASVERFTTGAGNWVFDVGTTTGHHVVVRIMRQREEGAAGIAWSQTLRPLGVPLPKLIGSHVPAAEATSERAWMVLERFPGRDLEHVYARLSGEQKLAILDHVLSAQRIVQGLPRGRGFGWIALPDEPPRHARWIDVLHEGLEISRDRIRTVGVVDERCVNRVRDLLPTCHLDEVEPVPFLDDTTTRNVLVDQGRFQGIVDVDGICYGDPLLVAALTRMSLLFRDLDTSYVEAWHERSGPQTEARRRRFEIYTALFAVNFLGELGQQFNLDAAPAVDPAAVRRLESILDALLARLI